MLDDGRLSGGEEDLLERLRETLSLSEDEAELILETRRTRLADTDHCPHCGKSLPPQE